MIPGIVAGAGLGGDPLPWEPSMLNPELYLDSRVAAAGITMKGDGVRVLSWADLGSSGATYSTPNTANGVGPKVRTLNGLRAVFFDASDSLDSLDGGTIARDLLNSANAVTLVVIGRGSTQAGDQSFVYWSINTSANGDGVRNWLRMLTSSNRLQFLARKSDAGSSITLASTSTGGTTPFVAVSRQNYTGDNHILRVNGTQEASTTFGNTTALSGSRSQYARLGRRGQSSNQNWLTADVFAVMLIKSAVSDADLERIEGWAAWTFTGDGSDFDLVAALPGGHPYKSAPP